MNISIKNTARLIKIFLSLIFYYTGLVAIIRNLIGQKGIKILAYHKIGNNSRDYLNMSIPVSDFETQIKYLNRHYRMVSLEEAVRSIQARKKIRKNTVVITFDDGYKDNYTNAFAITQKYNVPMTIFLCVDPINKDKPLWYEGIIQLIENASLKELDLSKYKMGHIILTNSSDKQAAIHQIIRQAKNMSEQQKLNLLNYLRQELTEGNVNDQTKYINKDLMLSWNDIREMKDYGVTYGAHTMSHPILARLPLQNAELEITNSKDAIEKELGQTISLFAYPNGGPEDFNKKIIEIVKRCGFTCACTLIPGVVRNGDDLFTIKRIGVDKEFIGGASLITRAIFATEMAGIFDIIFMRFLRNRGFKEE